MNNSLSSSAADTLLSGLNPQQKSAATFAEGHVLVLAGAGSGKTRVLTTRIAWLLHTRAIGPAAILAVTFTNKAAKEMLARLTALLDFSPRVMWVGTFHGLCHRLLRTHHYAAGLPKSFQIIDTADQLALVRRFYKERQISEEKFPPRETVYFINAHKEEGRRAAQVDAIDGATMQKRDLYQHYERYCREQGLVDFAELLLASYELLSLNEDLRTHYQQRFRHILVDEFQDTNTLQYHWLRLLLGENNFLFCVGDDDQSIYGFRGAQVGNMQDFADRYSAPIIRLEQNYRSSGTILNAANALIDHNISRLGKKLWTQAGAGDALRVYRADNDNEEARWIVDEVRHLRREGLALHKMAVLYRSNAQSRVLEHALFSGAIPYRVYGGQRFFDRQEIKHALAYLRLLRNPTDEVSFLRVINFPTRGIGTRSVEALQNVARQNNLPLSQAIEPLTHADPRAAATIARFTTLMETMRRDCQGLPLPEIVSLMLDQSGLTRHYQNDNAPDNKDKLSNLDELVNAVANFLTEGEGDLDEFLAHAALEAGEHQALAGQEALQLMTVHAAKGLEFDAVFICGLEEGLFPHEQSFYAPRGLEEERRLMYVAITRARQKLYLSLSSSRMLHGQLRYGLWSRFFEELPEELLHYLTDKPSAANKTSFSGVQEPAPTFLRGVSRAPSSAKPFPTATNANNFSANNASTSHRTGWRLGQQVLHPRFGSGVILAITGQGEDACARINFEFEGEKTIALALGKLQAVRLSTS